MAISRLSLLLASAGAARAMRVLSWFCLFLYSVVLVGAILKKAGVLPGVDRILVFTLFTALVLTQLVRLQSWWARRQTRAGLAKVS